MASLFHPWLPTPLLTVAWIPLLPLGAALVNGLWGARLPRGLVGLLACGSVLASFLLAVDVFSALSANPQHLAISRTLFTWFHSGGLHIDVALTVDHLSSIMILIITGVGFLIHFYSLGYMAHEPAYARYFTYLNLFMFAMLILVMGASLPVVFLGWEGVGLCSYLLIGFWYSDNDKANAGKKAFVVNRVGDFGFIVAMAVLFAIVGNLDFVSLQKAAQSGAISSFAATAVCLALILGATGKSAQLPLYVWLPDAMAGPTPVSALIHAATMVTAGIYMTARMSFLFVQAPLAMAILACIGVGTALFAATIALGQTDIKKVLAYSTVSQLGFMFLAAGVGAYAIALFHVVTHAFFKACLFLGSGSVIHGMSGEQDMRQMGGLWKKQPVTFATFFIATLAITGFPFTSGFMSKDAILWNAFSSAHGAHANTFASLAPMLWTVGVVTAGLTAFYMWRAVFLTFFSGPTRARVDVAHHIHESPIVMTLPLIVLAVASLVGGALGWPHILGGHDWIVEWLAPVVGISPAPQGDHVALELGLMAVSVVVAAIGFGVAFVLYARRIHPWTHRLATERPWRFWYAHINEKWHVDELYEVGILRPLQWFSKSVLYTVIDRGVIDGLVNAVGWLARSVGFLGQLFHSGNIQRYLAIFAVSLALLLYGWLTPSGKVREVPARPKPIDARLDRAPDEATPIAITGSNR